MPPRPCLDCGTPTRNGARCEGCTASNQRRRDVFRGTPAQRGYDGAWRALVVRLKAERGGVCELCGQPGTRDNPLSGDHITPLSRGGARLDPSNVRIVHKDRNSAMGGALNRRPPPGGTPA